MRWAVTKLPRLQLPLRPSAKKLAFGVLAVIIAFGIFRATHLFGSAEESDGTPVVGTVAFSTTDVACTNATWMIRQPNRITAPVERCFPLGDADFIIAIGDATPVGSHRDEEQRGRDRAESLARAIAARYPELRERIYALNAGVTTSANSGEFEANQVRAIIGNVSVGTVTDAEFVRQLRAHLASTWLGPHSLCNLYRLDVGARLNQIPDVTCKASQ